MNTTNTNTPRTDAHIKAEDTGPFSCAMSHGDIMQRRADFARQLERELIASQAEVARITKQLFDQHWADTNLIDAWRNEAETLRVELSRAEAENDRIVSDMSRRAAAMPSPTGHTSTSVNQ